jgi:hypothetical protein
MSKIKKSKIHKAVAKDVKKDEQSKRKSRTVIEKERLVKKQKAVGEEYLDEVAQENEEKAANQVIKFQKEVDENEKLKKDETTHILNKSKHGISKDSYTYKIVKELYKMARRIDWPIGYDWRVRMMEENKIDLCFISKNGQGFGKGIKLTFVSKYDLHACAVLATQCENTVDKLEGNLAWQRKTSKLNVPGTDILGPDGKPFN